MSSNLMDKIGLGSIDPAIILIVMLVLIIVLVVLNILLNNKFKKLQRQYESFMRGKNARNLETEIIRILKENRALKSAAERNHEDINTLFANMEYNYQKCGIVKYDAFRQMGGKLSFSLALLNQKNDGFIINSVHSSDGCYSYAKEIRGGNCDIDLSEEEGHALQLAMDV